MVVSQGYFTHRSVEIPLPKITWRCVWTSDRELHNYSVEVWPFCEFYLWRCGHFVSSTCGGVAIL